MKRRSFLSWLAAAMLPPLPRRKVVLESPKGKEQRISLRRKTLPASCSAVFNDPPGLVISSISKTGPNVTLSWGGGDPPYMVEYCTTVTGPWLSQGNATMAHSRTFFISAPQAFFRVRQKVALLFVSRDSQGVHLTWTIPDLE